MDVAINILVTRHEVKPAKPAAQPTPASLGLIPRMAAALPRCIFWPTASSKTSIGTPITMSTIAYARIKIHPPCLYVR